jgi:cysteinyl-tRNA synthetase
LADERADARARSDFSRADELRQEIVRLGWEVQDVAEGYRLIPRQ